jgi:hypothetical protein
MMRDSRLQVQLNGRWLAWGLTWGLVFGTGLALLYSPRSGPAFRQWVGSSAQSAMQRTRSRIENAAPTDGVAASLAEGKEMARRRREGLAT